MKKQKKFVSYLLSLAMMASLLTPAFAAEADSTNVIYDKLEGNASSDVTLQVVEGECSHGNKHYQDNGDGTHDYICDDCGDVLVDDEPHEDLDNSGTCDKCGTDVTPPGCSHGGSHYEDNGDGTHDKVCDGCGEVLVDDESHTDEDGDGTCDKCGADVTPPGCSHGKDRYVDNEDGETHDKICEGCGEILIDDEAHTDEDDDGICDLCGGKVGTDIDDPDVPGGDLPILVATVPLQLPIIMDLKGNITVADNAVIRNHVEDKAIAVKDIQVTAAEGWSLAAMADDFRLKDADTNVLAIGFRGNGMKADGSFELTEGNWNIGGATVVGEATEEEDSAQTIPGELALNMSAKIPVRTQTAETSSIATVQFTLDWAADAGAVTSDAGTGANDQANINASNDRTVTLTVDMDAVEHCTVDKDTVTTDRSGKITELPNVTADEGYEFKGWVDGNGNEVKVGDVLPESTGSGITIAPVVEAVKPATVSYIDKSRMQNALKSLTGSITFVDEVYDGEGGIDISQAQDKSVLAVVDGQDATVYGHKAYLPEDCSLAFNVLYNGGVARRGFLAQSMDLSGLDTSNVTNMQYMFEGCSGLTSLDLSGLDTSKVTDMYGMFEGCSGLTSLDLSSFDTSNVTSMYRMFFGCSSLTSLDLSSFDTSNVTNMDIMFYGCSSLSSLDLSSFDTSNVTSMCQMFYGCPSLSSLDLSGFDTSNVTDMRNMFTGCSNLTILRVRDPEEPAKYKSEGGLESVFALHHWEDAAGNKVSDDADNKRVAVYWVTTAINRTKMDSLFGSNGAKVTSISFEEGAVPEGATDIGAKPGLIYATLDGNKHGVIYLKNTYLSSCGSLFTGYARLTTVDLSGLDTSKVTSMVYMFYNCSSLTSVDLSGLDTSEVTDMGRMFDGCSSLTSLDLSSFDTSNVTGMYGMFEGCSSLTSLDLSGLDTSNVTNMKYMFQVCSSLTTLDVSSFDTSNVTDMRNMFTGCSNLTTLRVRDPEEPTKYKSNGSLNSAFTQTGTEEVDGRTVYVYTKAA